MTILVAIESNIIKNCKYNTKIHFTFRGTNNIILPIEHVGVS